MTLKQNTRTLEKHLTVKDYSLINQPVQGNNLVINVFLAGPNRSSLILGSLFEELEVQAETGQAID